MSRVYRNVFIRSGMPKFRGKEILRYSGRLYTNGENLMNRQGFDREMDIFLGCRCDADRYQSILKVTESKIRR